MPGMNLPAASGRGIKTNVRITLIVLLCTTYCILALFLVLSHIL